jgi:3-hydroxyisobutyrate dehydrogenase-like beta-hydroxyacid dehydrogenase
MSKVAFLGLGQMGAPMARRLIDEGHDVVVYNRTQAKAEPLVEQGAKAATSPAAAAGGVEAVFTMLATPDALEEVVFGDQGVSEVLAPGQALIEMSTVGPEAFLSLRRRLSESVKVLDAPVLGSVPQATEGKLQVYCGANRHDFEQYEPLLAAFGTVRWVGEPGAGAAMKLVVNSTLGVIIGALGEALALGETLGLERAALLDVLADSPLGATAKSKRESIEGRSYPPRFKLSLAAKDAQLVTEAAAARGLELPVVAAARRWMDAANADGLGGCDYSAVVAKILGERPHEV